MSRASEAIRHLWKEQNERWTLNTGFGVRPKDMVREVEKANSRLTISSLNGSLLVYDEFLSWYVSLHIALFPKLGTFKDRENAEANAFIILIGALLSHGFAIRRLVISGFDLAAKQVLRSPCEYVDIMLLIAVDPSIAGEFLETDSQERSDAFWRKHFQRRKARRQFYRYLDRYVDGSGLPLSDVLSEFINYRNEEDNVLSMSAHPSMVAAVMSMTSQGTEFPGYYGSKGGVSNRTLRYAIWALNEFPLYAGYIPFGPAEGRAGGMAGSLPVGRPLITYDDADRAHRHIKKGRSVLFGLIAYTLGAAEAGELATGSVQDIEPP